MCHRSGRWPSRTGWGARISASIQACCAGVAGEWLQRNGRDRRPCSGGAWATVDPQGSIRRLLVAQALIEGVTLVTVDEVVGRYSGPIRVL